MTREVLQAEGLVKSFNGRRVVDRVDIALKRHEVVGLLGPNGAGKTTTFYMIAGLMMPVEGKVYLDGEDITRDPIHLRARKGIHYLAQEPSVFRNLTVEENILAILETLGLSARERGERAESLLAELSIEHLRKQKASSLSGGERRRLEITRALCIEPRFMLLDEPFSGIDPLIVNEIQQIIRQLKGQGIGIMISDHNVRETLGVCDTAHIISDGKIVESGPPEKIVESEVARCSYLGENFCL